MRSRNALALLNMMVFVLLFSILSTTILTLLNSHTRAMEHYVRRTKAQFAAEGACAQAYIQSFFGDGPNGIEPVDWAYDVGGSLQFTKDMTLNDYGSTIDGTQEISYDCNYALDNW